MSDMRVMSKEGRGDGEQGLGLIEWRTRLSYGKGRKFRLNKRDLREKSCLVKKEGEENNI